MGHNGVRTTEDSQEDAKLKWQNRSPEQFRLKSDEQMSTFLPHSKKIV